jgi:hypothetical protein
MITFQLTIDQFERMLAVVLDEATPNHLSDLVLLACKRPKAGIIDVPVPRDEAIALADLMEVASAQLPDVADVARLMREQAAG